MSMFLFPGHDGDLLDAAETAEAIANTIAKRGAEHGFFAGRTSDEIRALLHESVSLDEIRLMLEQDADARASSDGLTVSAGDLEREAWARVTCPSIVVDVYQRVLGRWIIATDAEPD